MTADLTAWRKSQYEVRLGARTTTNGKYIFTSEDGTRTAELHHEGDVPPSLRVRHPGRRAARARGSKEQATKDLAEGTLTTWPAAIAPDLPDNTLTIWP